MGDGDLRGLLGSDGRDQRALFELQRRKYYLPVIPGQEFWYVKQSLSGNPPIIEKVKCKNIACASRYCRHFLNDHTTYRFAGIPAFLCM